MQIRSRDLLGAIFSFNSFLAKWHHFLQHLGGCHQLYNVNTAKYFISVPGPVEFLENERINKNSLLSGDWALVQNAAYFQN